MIQHARSLIALVLAAQTTAAACAGSADASPDAWTVSDSAGVRIVENYRPAWTLETAWTVSTSPAFSANDELDDPNPLMRPVDAIRLADGRIAVVDVQAAAIAVYDPTGQRLADIGRRGSGPGELRTAWFLDRWKGDSLITYDSGLNRYSVFGTNGEFGRSYEIERSSELPYATATGMFPDGGSLILGSLLGATEYEQGLTRRGLPLYRSQSEDNNPIALPAHITREHYIAETGLPDPPTISIPALFAHNQEVTIAGDLLAFGTTSRLEIAMADATGRITQIARLRQDPIELTQSHRQTAEELLLARTTREFILKGIRRALPNMPERQHLPAFGRWAWEYAPKAQQPSFDTMTGDTEGNVWIISYAPPGTTTPRPWMVIAPNGRWLGNVTLPMGFEPFDIGNDYVLGWRKDENDLIRIEQYTLTKPST
jgi:hypothetical protein